MKPPRTYVGRLSVCAECGWSFHYCMYCDIHGKLAGAMSSGFCSVACAVKWSRRSK